MFITHDVSLCFRFPLETLLSAAWQYFYLRFLKHWLIKLANIIWKSATK